MPRHLIAGIVFVATLAAHAGEASDVVTGLAELRIDDATRSLTAHVYYPGRRNGPPMRFAENAVWQGFDAYPNAPAAPGRFPLVVISHGLYGNSFNQAWLAGALVRAGFIVVAPDHPGTSTWRRERAARARLWERPRDLQRTVTAMLTHPRFGALIAPDKVAAIGHSLGGYDVMALLGARFDAARHQAYCMRHPGRPDCVFVREAGIGRDPASQELLRGELRDPRVKATVTLDLALTQALDPASVASAEGPVLVIGAAADDSLALEDESRALAATLPGGTVRYLEMDLGHYDFLGLCKAGAESILRAEEPGIEIICRAGGRARADRHASIIEHVKAFLQDALALQG